MNWLANILRGIADAIDPPSPVPKPTAIKKMTFGDLRKMLQDKGLRCMVDADPDYEITYTDEENWKRIVPYLVYPADKYAFEATDCDDYAKKASSESAWNFGLTGCLEAWHPGHAFNLVITGATSFKLFDANAGYEYAGELFDFGEHSYKPDSWKF